MMRAPNFDSQAHLSGLLADDGWATPDTYCKLFAPLENIPGVYTLLAVEKEFYERAFVAYVGMSEKLLQRLSSHPVAQEIEEQGLWVMRWFKPSPAQQLRDVEREYIGRFDPPWNIIGKKRGVVIK